MMTICEDDVHCFGSNNTIREGDAPAQGYKGLL